MYDSFYRGRVYTQRERRVSNFYKKNSSDPEISILKIHVYFFPENFLSLFLESKFKHILIPC